MATCFPAVFRCREGWKVKFSRIIQRRFLVVSRVPLRHMSFNFEKLASLAATTCFPAFPYPLLPYAACFSHLTPRL